MQIRAIYEDKVFKPLKDLNLSDKAEVRLTVRRRFSDLLDELGEPDAEEYIHLVLRSMRERSYNE